MNFEMSLLYQLWKINHLYIILNTNYEAVLCPLCPNKNTIGTNFKTTYKSGKNNERVKYTCQHLGKYKFEIPIRVYIVNNGENCHDNCKIKYIKIYLIRKVGRHDYCHLRKKSEHERKIQFYFKYLLNWLKNAALHPPPDQPQICMSCNSVTRLDYPFQNNLNKRPKRP